MSLFSVRLESAAIQDLGDIDTKNELLKRAAYIAADIYDLDRHDVYDRLLEREALGSTGFGGATAIPHAKVANLDSCVGVFLRLDNPVEFASHDGKPVDLTFVLLSPENGGVAHLKALAEISRFLRDEKMVSKLRGAGSSDALVALLTGQLGQQAA